MLVRVKYTRNGLNTSKDLKNIKRPHLMKRFRKPKTSYSQRNGAACKTRYIRKTIMTIYFAYAKLYVLYKVYTFAYAKTCTCAKHIVLHMQKYTFCIAYEKLYILNKKRRAFHEEAPTNKITTDTAFVFCVLRHV